MVLVTSASSVPLEDQYSRCSGSKFDVTFLRLVLAIFLNSIIVNRPLPVARSDDYGREKSGRTPLRSGQI
jgi:hypothetical protein